ncbi:Hsp20/alpha crystallin family protein [Pseudodesulfovibrio senegalensis]|jgi:HSP20 family protein|uniref:Hsp20/alpha crystallin family protein n=2 Tax=Pseudodesulfovibrio senegalensis TaxID=1721087 RepID=A0A6N6MWU8_9BACT|nr:Hsp20/alpha crystallin family protein [Pseudodesulfovibrio senegalensis]
MGKMNWNPWMGLDMAAEELDQLMGEACPGGARGAAAVWKPVADMVEDRTGVTLRLDLPGVALEDVAVEIRGNELLVYGVRRSGSESSSNAFHVLERPCGPFARRFSLPVAVDRDSVCARLKHGVLTVTVERKSAERRIIPVD